MASAGSYTATSAVEAYEKYLVPPVFDPWARLVVELAEPRAGEYVLDLACGTGVATRRAAQRTGKAVGVDISAAMIEVARRHDQPDNGIEWQWGDACSLELADATFDLCLCLQGLQHFSDRERALGHIRRVLKQSGRLVAAVWAHIEETPGVHAVLQAVEAEHIEPGAFKRPFALGDADALRALVTRAGFGDVQVRTQQLPARFASVDAFLLALSAGSAASRDALQRVSTARWSAFAADVERRLAHFVGAEGLVFPYRAHVVIARP